MNEEITVFDKKEEFNENILPLIVELRKQCAIHKIPMLATFAVTNDEKHTDYKSFGMFSDPEDIYLTDDRLKQEMLAIAGFKMVSPKHIDPFADEKEFDMDKVFDTIDIEEEEKITEEVVKKLEGIEMDADIEFKEGL